MQPFPRFINKKLLKEPAAPAAPPGPQQSPGSKLEPCARNWVVAGSDLKRVRPAETSLDQASDTTAVLSPRVLLRLLSGPWLPVDRLARCVCRLDVSELVRLKRSENDNKCSTRRSKAFQRTNGERKKCHLCSERCLIGSSRR